MKSTGTLEKIVSGGQTGVDRGALDAALFLGVACGGWCPRGRLAEDGPIDETYPLTETASSRYSERTERNVVDSDATLILCTGTPSGGTRLTVSVAKKHSRPFLVADPRRDEAFDAVSSWLDSLNVAVLNVAGPRESGSPGIGRAARDFMEKVLARHAK